MFDTPTSSMHRARLPLQSPDSMLALKSVGTTKPQSQSVENNSNNNNNKNNSIDAFNNILSSCISQRCSFIACTIIVMNLIYFEIKISDIFIKNKNVNHCVYVQISCNHSKNSMMD